jgi:hypothetical protein
MSILPPPDPTIPFRQERELIADACRGLAGRGLTDGILGHISLRIDDERLLVRCRGPWERGLGNTTPDIRLIRSSAQKPRKVGVRVQQVAARPLQLVVYVGPPWCPSYAVDYTRPAVRRRESETSD